MDVEYFQIPNIDIPSYIFRDLYSYELIDLDTTVTEDDINWMFRPDKKLGITLVEKSSSPSTSPIISVPVSQPQQIIRKPSRDKRSIDGNRMKISISIPERTRPGSSPGSPNNSGEELNVKPKRRISSLGSSREGSKLVINKIEGDKVTITDGEDITGYSLTEPFISHCSRSIFVDKWRMTNAKQALKISNMFWMYIFERLKVNTRKVCVNLSIDVVKNLEESSFVLTASSILEKKHDIVKDFGYSIVICNITLPRTGKVLSKCGYMKIAYFNIAGGKVNLYAKDLTESIEWKSSINLNSVVNVEFNECITHLHNLINSKY